MISPMSVLLLSPGRLLPPRASFSSHTQMTTTNTPKKPQRNRNVNPAVLKLYLRKCQANHNQVVQWDSIKLLRYRVNAVYPGLLIADENSDTIRIQADPWKIKPPSLWRRIKFLFKH